MTIAPSTSNPSMLQNAVPQHHHRQHGGASNNASQTSAVTSASSTPSETVEEPAAPTPTVPKGGIDILA